MLARLRTLREWLLRRNAAPLRCIGIASPTASRRVLVGVLRQYRGTPTRPFVALRASRRSARLRCRKSTARSCKQLVAANTGKRVIAFTHKPVLGDDPVAAENRHLIALAVKAGFTVNLSANNPASCGPTWPSWDRPGRDRARPCLCAPCDGHRFKRQATNGPRRSANGVTARHHCHGARRPAGGSRFAPRPIRTPPARVAAPAPALGTP